MGWLARQYGLACDNVVSYQVVTAEGEVMRASRTEHPALFWGLRGGGEGAVTVGSVWVGDPAGRRLLLPALRSLGRPAGERVYEPSYLELQSRDDTVGRHALRRYSKGHYLRELPDAAIDAFLRRG